MNIQSFDASSYYNSQNTPISYIDEEFDKLEKCINQIPWFILAATVTATALLFFYPPLIVPLVSCVASSLGVERVTVLKPEIIPNKLKDFTEQCRPLSAGPVFLPFFLCFLPQPFGAISSALVGVIVTPFYVIGTLNEMGR